MTTRAACGQVESPCVRVLGVRCGIYGEVGCEVDGGVPRRDRLAVFSISLCGGVSKSGGRCTGASCVASLSRQSSTRPGPLQMVRVSRFCWSVSGGNFLNGIRTLAGLQAKQSVVLPREADPLAIAHVRDQGVALPDVAGGKSPTSH